MECIGGRVWTSHSQRLSRSKRSVRTKIHSSDRHYSHVHQSDMDEMRSTRNSNSNDIFLKISFTKILFMMIWGKFRKLLEIIEVLIFSDYRKIIILNHCLEIMKSIKYNVLFMLKTKILIKLVYKLLFSVLIHAV